MSKPLLRAKKRIRIHRILYIAEGVWSTVREIAAVHLSSPSTVHVHLKTLEEKGYIVRDPLKSRSIALPGKHEQEESFGSTGSSNTLSLPLKLEMSRQGEPILAEQNVETTMQLPTEIVGDSASFILAVHGESMIEAGINDGDYVMVKSNK